MASLVSEYSVSVVNNHVIKSSEQALYNQKTVYSTPKLDSCEAASSSNDSFGSTPVITKIKNEIKSATKVAANALTGKGSGSSGEVDELRKMIEDVKLQNESLKKEVDELRVLVGKLLSNKGDSSAHETPPKTSTAAPAGDADEDFDLFGSDDDEERETEEQKRIREERLTAYAAKKAKKPDPIAKSSVILDVKPWDDETDLNKMAECVKSIKKDGLVWGASKFIPIGYGIKKLQIVCTIEDEKVSVDADLVEHIQEEFADFVQSVDIVAFNKI